MEFTTIPVLEPSFFRCVAMLQSTAELEFFATCGLNDLLEWSFARSLSFGFERSVRFSRNTMETRRGLLTFAVSDFKENACSDVIQICRWMSMPNQLLESMTRFFSAAAYVHFGFEQSKMHRIGKCYLELAPSDAGRATLSGRLQFLGFKWSIRDSSVAVVSRYRSLVLPSLEAAQKELHNASGEMLRSVVLDFVTSLISSRKSSAETFGNNSDLTLLDIEEEGSDRRSVDLNVYDFGLSLSAFQTAFEKAGDAFQIFPSAVRSWFDSVAETPAGHIATGLGRDGQPFLTIYFDARTLSAPGLSGR